MRILLLLTSHNSLSQRLTTILDELSSDIIKGPKHEPSNGVQNLTYTIEYALNEQAMLKAVERVKPDVIVGAFLTKKVPRAIWSKYLCLILHPGPPGDAGPSAIDWALMGDSGAYEDASEALEKESLDPEAFVSGSLTKRKQWGVTCLQAEEEFDQGPIWAFETFDIPQEITKSALYRGPVTQAACECIITALARIQQARAVSTYSEGQYSPALLPPADFAVVTITGKPNEIINPRHRPLLKPNQRATDPKRHTAGHVAAIIRAGDSQPGVQVTWLDYENGKKTLFLYGAWVENGDFYGWDGYEVGMIVATRQGAILVKCRHNPEAPQERGVWITHARSPMSKETKVLPPKLPAVDALIRAGLEKQLEGVPEWPLENWDKVDGIAGKKTWQQVWVEKVPLGSPEGGTVLYVHFDFYNGACSTQQCELLLKAIIESVESDHTIRVLCLMGSRNYFSNGIALNVIEANPDPAKESWMNINAIDDVVEYLLGDSSPRAETRSTAFMKGRKTLTERGIITISAIQSNAAAGGLALATCCDIVLCSANAVLNPHYRSVGLFGSEFHRYHWPARVGVEAGEGMMRRMLPIGPEQARGMGLVDEVIGSRSSSPDDIEMGIKDYICRLARARLGQSAKFPIAPWLKKSSAEPVSPITSLLDDLVRAKRAHHASLPFPLVTYRTEELSQMLLDFHHPVRSKRYHDRRRAFIGKHLPQATPLRFAEHAREKGGVELDEEERMAFDRAPGWKRGEEWAWVGESIPEGFLEFKPFEAGLLSKKMDDQAAREETIAPDVQPTYSSDHTQSSSDSDRSKPSTDSSSTRQTLSPSLPNRAATTSTTRDTVDKTQPGRGKRNSLDLRSTFKRALGLATWNKGSIGPELTNREHVGIPEVGREGDLEDLRVSDDQYKKEPETETQAQSQARLIQAHQTAGVIFTHPSRVHLQPSINISPGVQIGIDVQLWGSTSLASGVKVEGPTILIDARVSEGALIRPFSHLEGCRLGPGARVGPFARLRHGDVIDNHEDGEEKVKTEHKEKDKGKEAQAILYPCYYSVPDEAQKEEQRK